MNKASSLNRRSFISRNWLCLLVCFASALALAETPGQFRPQPVAKPETSGVGAIGTRVQPPEDFPKSHAPFSPVTRKPKLAQLGRPALRDSATLVLNAGWELAEAPRVKSDGTKLSQPGVDTGEWYDATVPGTVLTTLVEQGVYPDPYFGLNNLAIPESLCRQDYWYRTEFALPAKFAGRELWLEFGGINYYAEVWFNGEYLGHITGAFIRGNFNVTKLARRDGPNVLAVMIVPPPNPGIPHEQSVKGGPGYNGGTMCLDGPTFVCSEGWDWIPAMRDRCSGIWQEVVLRVTGPVALGDAHVITDLPLPDTSRADVTIETEVRNATDLPQEGVLRATFEGVKLKQRVSLQPNETKTVVFPSVALKNPRLWWPNGYGKQELYHLELSFNDSDRKTLRFGVREMTYEFAATFPDGGTDRVEFAPIAARGGAPVIDNCRETITQARRGKDHQSIVGIWPGSEKSPALHRVTGSEMGIHLVVKVNGQPILCRGGNWGMDDAMKRISRERLEPYMRLSHEANMTMIRNWAGQSTSPVFYDLCDEYGLLVWNDFWLNTEGYNYNPLDQDLFLRNVTDTLKRYRVHPSIALWCPRNEGIPPDPLHGGIDRAVRELDGTRYYQPNSRQINLRPSGPWSNHPLEKYFTDFGSGFSTELGACSVPSAEVVRSFIPEADLWPDGDVWAYHDLHSKGSGDRASLMNRLTNRFGEVTSLGEFCRKSQMVNYETHRAMFEGFNARLWKDCSGVLAWMSHPSWPSVVWQFYTWDYEANASYFGIQKAGEMTHIQMNFPDCDVAVVNHRATPLETVTAHAEICDLSGRVVASRDAKINAAPNSVTNVFRLDWPAKDAHLVTLTLSDAKGGVLSRNLYWHAREEKDLQQLNALPTVELTGNLTVKKTKSGIRIVGTLTNATTTPALMTRLVLRNADTGQRVLPAYFADNFISLMPGEAREFRIECNKTAAKLQVDLDGWNITPTVLR